MSKKKQEEKRATFSAFTVNITEDQPTLSVSPQAALGHVRNIHYAVGLIDGLIASAIGRSADSGSRTGIASYNLLDLANTIGNTLMKDDSSEQDGSEENSGGDELS